MYKLVASSSAILALAVIGSCHEQKTVQVAPQQPTAQAEPAPQGEQNGEANQAAANNAAPGESSPVGERGGACPTAVAGTKVNMVDVAGGIALDFTSKANVAALRERVHQLAQAPSSGSSSMNNEDSADTNAPGVGGGAPDGVRVPALATVEDLPDGARLILTPQDANQLPSLRAQTSAQIPQLDQGDCSGLAISNAQARTPEPKANKLPPNGKDPDESAAPEPDTSAQPQSQPDPDPPSDSSGEEPQPESPQP